MNETYIMTWEDGKHYFAKEITDIDKQLLSDGSLSIIRCSDAKKLTKDGEWIGLKEWCK